MIDGKVRLGIVGAGAWVVAAHLPVLESRRSEIEYVGVSRRSADLLEQIRAEWGFAMASTDYRELIAQGLDACIVASPAGLHHEHAKAALEAGAHVVVEKPFTITPDEAWDLAHTARRVGRELFVAFGWNFGPFAQAVRQALAAHPIGRVEQAILTQSSGVRRYLLGQGTYGESEQLTTRGETWANPDLSGGGYGPGQLSHGLGLLFLLSGLRPQEVFAFMGGGHDGVEFHDAISVRFEDGAVGTCAGAATSAGQLAGHHVTLKLVGDRGQLYGEIPSGRITLDSDGETTQLEAPDHYGFQGPPNALLDTAQGKAVDNPASGEIGALTVEVLDAARRSAESGKAVQIER